MYNKIKSGKMEKNIFVEQPEFIDSDPRKNRPSRAGTKVTSRYIFLKQAILLPTQLIKDKKVLDLGSCTAASGAWVLTHGASFYKGIEIQKEWVESSKSSMSKYYPDDLWDIEQSTIEGFLNSNEESYDLVIASGVIHALPDPMKIIKKIAEMANIVVIESAHPTLFKKTNFLNDKLKETILNDQDYESFIENEPFIDFGMEGMGIPDEKTLLFNSFKPSMGIVKILMNSEGFVYIDDVNQKLKNTFPNIYSKFKRYGALFIKRNHPHSKDFGFISALSGDSISKVYKWDQ
jgi:predicted nicotinamide N-methyase